MLFRSPPLAQLQPAVSGRSGINGELASGVVPHRTLRLPGRERPKLPSLIPSGTIRLHDRYGKCLKIYGPGGCQVSSSRNSGGLLVTDCPRSPLVFSPDPDLPRPASSPPPLFGTIGLNQGPGNGWIPHWAWWVPGTNEPRVEQGRASGGDPGGPLVFRHGYRLALNASG